MRSEGLPMSESTVQQEMYLALFRVVQNNPPVRYDIDRYTVPMTYQIWDLASRNLIDEFDVEAEALEAAKAYLTPDEDGVTIEVALVLYGDADGPTRSIHGDELTTMVFASPAGEAKRLA